MDARRRMTTPSRVPSLERVKPMPTRRSSPSVKHIETRSRRVATEPVMLLAPDVMERLYDEQLRAASPVHKPRKSIRSSTSSRPRTSTSSSQPLDEDGVSDRAVFSASIQLDNANDRHRLSSASVSDRECQVCYESVEASVAHTCSTCRTSFCRNCMRWYIEYKILEGQVSAKKLVCPAPQCSESLDEAVIQSFVAPATFDKYLLYRENQRPGVRYCPRAGCGAKIDEPLYSTSRRVLCSTCDEESCMKCGSSAHVLPTCRRRDRRYGKWKKHSNVRPCPRCKSDIEKQGGCAHMKCFQCDAEFCWACMRPWDDHNETLCVPLKFLRSKDPKYGRWAPVRVVTKTAVVGAATVVAVTGVGLAVVFVPPVLLMYWMRGRRSARHRESLHTDAFIVE